MTTSLRERLLAAANQADNECRDSAERAGFEIVLFTGSKIGALLHEAAAALTAPASPPALEAVEWLRNNYDAYPNIASLCDAMQAALASPVAVQPEGGDAVAIGSTRCLPGDEWVQTLTVRGVPFLVPLDRMNEARHILTRPVAAQQADTRQRPSQEWYRKRIMESLDDEPSVIGGGWVRFVCSNRERRHPYANDPQGPCPSCVSEGAGNWSCIAVEALTQWEAEQPAPPSAQPHETQEGAK